MSTYVAGSGVVFVDDLLTTDTPPAPAPTEDTPPEPLAATPIFDTFNRVTTDGYHSEPGTAADDYKTLKVDDIGVNL
jgi:hypothetical protein